MKRLILCATAFALTLLTQAQAQTVPFALIGSGTAEFIPVVAGTTATHDSYGVATHLGLFSSQGTYKLLTVDYTTLTGTFESPVPYVFVAANGDKLAVYYGNTAQGATSPGTFKVYPAANGKVYAVFLAEFVPKVSLCTGHFARLKRGSFTLLAVTEPFILGSTTPVRYSWAGTGTLTFGTSWKGSASGVTVPSSTPGVDSDTFGGNSTVVGRFSSAGTHTTDWMTGEFDGAATWTDKKGHKVNVVYEGQLFPSGNPDFPFGFVGEITIVGGTGRYGNATGRCRMTGLYEGAYPADFKFDFEGWIDLD